MMLRKPTCADCPHNLQYMERLPIKKKGVTMHLGERFCVAGKRARKFKRSDPKTYVPSWCPRLKAPCELRIYGFKNQREWRMHRSMRAYLGEDTSPSAFRYAVRYEGHTDLAPYEFFECCNEKSDDEILGAAVQHYDVVEIDDGMCEVKVESRTRVEEHGRTVLYEKIYRGVPTQGGGLRLLAYYERRIPLARMQMELRAAGHEKEWKGAA